jgi:hypothetical protein
MGTEADTAASYALTGQWVLIAAAIIGLVVRLLKEDTWLPTLPPRARAAYALGLGAASGLLEHVFAGTPWKQALLGGVVAATLATFGHDVVIQGLRGGRELPLPTPLLNAAARGARRALKRPPPSPLEVPIPVVVESESEPVERTTPTVEAPKGSAPGGEGRGDPGASG